VPRRSRDMSEGPTSESFSKASQLRGYAVSLPNNGIQSATSAHQWSGAFLVAILIGGIAVGSIVTWAFLLSPVDSIAPWVGIGTQSVLFIFVGVAIALLVVAPLVVVWLYRFARKSRGTLEGVVKELGAASRAIGNKDGGTAALHVEGAALEVLAWYGPMAVRKWIVQAVVALLVTLGGLVGTALLFRQIVLLDEQNKKLQEQTALLRDQNDKIDLQTVTAEAQRRSVLASELFALLQAVSTKGAVSEGNHPGQIDRILKARIIAFSRAATPYWTVEILGEPTGRPRVPSLARRARSPERGQLLVGLVAAGVDLQELRDAVFDSADLRRAPLKRAKLAGLRMNNADLSYAELHGADLRGTQLALSDLSFTIFEGVFFDDDTIFDLAVVGPDLNRQSIPSAPLSWKSLPEKYVMHSQNGVLVLTRKGGPPKMLPFIYPE
jgi:hypothetical protein